MDYKLCATCPHFDWVKVGYKSAYPLCRARQERTEAVSVEECALACRVEAKV
jgi:hypothetical protein